MAVDGEQADIIPHFDFANHKLWFDGKLVKHFRQPAESQELLLKAFEEDGWQPIDDPLRPKPGRDSKRHLRNTVGNLNRYQINRLIRFRCNGTGTGVSWERW